jgi:hypothetical protein
LSVGTSDEMYGGPHDDLARPGSLHFCAFCVSNAMQCNAMQCNR